MPYGRLPKRQMSTLLSPILPNDRHNERKEHESDPGSYDDPSDNLENLRLGAVLLNSDLLAHGVSFLWDGSL